MKTKALKRKFLRPHRPATRRPTRKDMAANALVWALVIAVGLAVWTIIVLSLLSWI